MYDFSILSGVLLDQVTINISVEEVNTLGIKVQFSKDKQSIQGFLHYHYFEILSVYIKVATYLPVKILQAKRYSS